MEAKVFHFKWIMLPAFSLLLAFSKFDCKPEVFLAVLRIFSRIFSNVVSLCCVSCHDAVAYWRVRSGGDAPAANSPFS
jgi:hypothetical protein